MRSVLPTSLCMCMLPTQQQKKTFYAMADVAFYTCVGVGASGCMCAFVNEVPKRGQIVQVAYWWAATEGFQNVYQNEVFMMSSIGSQSSPKLNVQNNASFSFVPNSVNICLHLRFFLFEKVAQWKMLCDLCFAYCLQIHVLMQVCFLQLEQLNTVVRCLAVWGTLGISRDSAPPAGTSLVCVLIEL